MYGSLALTKEIGNSRIRRIGYSLQAFSIANAILWIGNFVYAITTGESLLILELLDFDLSIILLYASFAQVVVNPLMFGFAVLGWVIASFWAKKDHPRDHVKIIMYSVTIPFLFLPTLLLVFILNLAVGVLQYEYLLLVLIFVITLVIINIIALAVAIPGIAIVSFINPLTPEKSKIMRC